LYRPTIGYFQHFGTSINNAYATHFVKSFGLNAKANFNVRKLARKMCNSEDTKHACQAVAQSEAFSLAHIGSHIPTGSHIQVCADRLVDNKDFVTSYDFRKDCTDRFAHIG